MLSCYIVKDLLPNYIDGITCEETKQEIAGHLENCDDCRADYGRMTAPIVVTAPAEKPDINFLKTVKKKVWRNIAVVSGSILVAAAILIWNFDDEYRLTYNWNGEVTWAYSDMNPDDDWDNYGDHSKDIQPTHEEMNFLQGQQPNEIRNILWPEDDKGYQQIYTGRTHLDTLDDLREILKNADVPSLRVPTYIPLGYSIESICFWYVQSAEMIEMAPDEIEISADGNEMTIKRFPENYRKCVERYTIGYVNKTKGSRIDIIEDFNELAAYSREFPATSKSKISNPVIEGYERSIMVINARLPELGTPHPFTDGEVLPYNYISVGHNAEYTEPYSNYGFTDNGNFDSIVYNFYVSNDRSIGEKELIKLVEGLEPVER